MAIVYLGLSALAVGCAGTAPGTSGPDWSSVPNSLLTAENACARVIGRTPPSDADPKFVALTQTMCRPDSPTYTKWPTGLGWFDIEEFAQSLCGRNAEVVHAPTKWYSQTDAPPSQVDEFAGAVIAALGSAGHPQC